MSCGHMMCELDEEVDYCPHQWQPIETAPPTSYKGDHIWLLCTQSHYPPYQTEGWLVPDNPPTNYKGGWMSAQGWVDATHWMPLPPLPAGGQQ